MAACRLTPKRANLDYSTFLIGHEESSLSLSLALSRSLLAGRLVPGHSPFESELSGAAPAADRNSDDEDERSEGGTLTIKQKASSNEGDHFLRCNKFITSM